MLTLPQGSILLKNKTITHTNVSNGGQKIERYDSKGKIKTILVKADGKWSRATVKRNKNGDTSTVTWIADINDDTSERNIHKYRYDKSNKISLYVKYILTIGDDSKYIKTEVLRQKFKYSNDGNLCVHHIIDHTNKKNIMELIEITDTIL